MNGFTRLNWKWMVAGSVCALSALALLAVLRRGAPQPLPVQSAAPTDASSPAVPAGAEDLFEDVAGKAGLDFAQQLGSGRLSNIIESIGAGGVVFDYDGDGWQDIYLVNSGPAKGLSPAPPGTPRQPNRLFRNRGNGTFADVTRQAGVGGQGYGVSAVAADYDNDGHPDLYVVNIGRNLLYRNRGDGTFAEVTDTAGVGHPGTGLAAVFFDADNDGWLDLFVVNYLTFDPHYRLHYQPDVYPGPLAYQAEFNALYRNRGDGTFEDVSQRAGVRVPGHRGMGVAAFDFDLDGDQDLYVANDATPNLLLENDGAGRFRDVSVERGVAYNQNGEAAGSMAAAVGDCNGDGLPDILVTRFGYGSLYLGTRQGWFDDRIVASGVGALAAQFTGWGGNFFDCDNDGDLDIFICNGDIHYLVGWESLLLENRGDGRFTDAAAQGGAWFKARWRGRGSAVADFDNDGRLDLLMTQLSDRAALLRNRDRSGHHWLGLDLRGSQSNRDGFGARVKLTAGGRTQHAEACCPTGYLLQGDRRLHFGLGASATAERIEIRWPAGQTQVLTNVAADQILRVREPDKRS